MRQKSVKKAETGPRNWRKTAVFMLAAIVVSYLAAVNSLANIARRKNPEIALMVSREEPVALTTKADREFQATQTPSALTGVERQARRALRQQAHNAAAIRLLGYVADVRGNSQEAQRFVNMSSRVSRRDFGTQIWLIEQAAQKEQLAKALLHYDIALRTTIESRSILFPTLINALASEDVRRAFTPYVSNAPTWMLDFIPQAIAEIENPSDIVSIMMAANNSATIPEYKNFPNLLLSQLESKRKFSDYRRYYLSLPESEPRLLSSVDINKSSILNRYSSIGWQSFNGAAVGSSFSATAQKSGFHLQAYARPNTSGLVARKLLFLGAGNYVLSARYDATSAGLDADLTWQIQCLSHPGNTVFTVTNIPIAAGKFYTLNRFAMPSDCSAQYLNLFVTDGNSQSGMDISMERLKLITVSAASL